MQHGDVSFKIVGAHFWVRKLKSSSFRKHSPPAFWKLNLPSCKIGSVVSNLVQKRWEQGIPGGRLLMFQWARIVWATLSSANDPVYFWISYVQSFWSLVLPMFSLRSGFVLKSSGGASYHGTQCNIWWNTIMHIRTPTGTCGPSWIVVHWHYESVVILRTAYPQANDIPIMFLKKCSVVSKKTSRFCAIDKLSLFALLQF